MIGLWAVHITDGVLTWPWLLAGLAGACLLLGWATRGMHDRDIPLVAVLSAAFFIGSTVHIRLPGTSVHLVLNGLAGILLGRRAPLAIAVGLMLQSLLLGHGGLMTLGVNFCAMTVPALVAGALFRLWPSTTNAWVRSSIGGGACALAVLGTALIQSAAIYCGAQEALAARPLELGSITLPLAAFLLIVHVPVALVEGAIATVLIRSILVLKPEILGTGHGLATSRG